MNVLKILGLLGLLLLIGSRILLSQGPEFLYFQHPVDFAHWMMLVGAIFTLSFSFLFPKNIFNFIATPLTLLGVIAHVGMSSIDMVFWSFGEDHQSRDSLIRHLMETPVIWVPFFTLGPALLYAGLATQAWWFIRSHTPAALLTILGSAGVGLGQMVWSSQIIIVASLLVFAVGLTLLVYRQEEQHGRYQAGK